jgi:O-antigen ligase
MNSATMERFLARSLGIGAFLTTVLVYTSVSDPVNVPKMVVLATLAFGVFGVLVFSLKSQLFSGDKFIVIGMILFVLTSILAVLQSTSPFNQNLFGTYGRNTGLLTYFSLVLLMLVASKFQRIENFRFLLWSLLGAGFVNVVYCLWVVLFGDFIGWSNPYKNILGTFGNPNFIGAFLGIFISVYVAYLINPGTKIVYRLIGGAVLVVSLYEVKSSHAVQGIVVSAGGVALVGFLYLRSRFKGNLIPSIYAGALAMFGSVAVLGALQIGPLTDLIYKTSVSLRGEYWQAAINMAKMNPFSGVGMDAYGDWYRRARDAQAMILPGPSVVTNAAHNVPLDLLAYGGIPLFVSFLILFTFSAISAVRIVFRNRTYDWVGVGLVVGWTCYHVQSVISINQIGLAIWGWIFNGAVIAYDRATRASNAEVIATVVKKSPNRSMHSQVISPQLIFGLTGALGFILAFPAFNSDYQYRRALATSQAPLVQKALEPTFMTPTNSRFLAEAAGLFENSKIPDLARKYALEGVAYNPDYFDAWRTLYGISTSTPEEKAEAKKNLIRLDPLNQEWKNLP